MVLIPADEGTGKGKWKTGLYQSEIRLIMENIPILALSMTSLSSLSGIHFVARKRSGVPELYSPRCLVKPVCSFLQEL